jgi:retinoid hydroxylase
MFALRLFFMAGFGCVDKTAMHQLHDDFTLWIHGFGSLVTLRRMPLSRSRTRFGIAMDARDRILATVESLILKFRNKNPPSSERAQKSMMGRGCYGTDDDGNPFDMEDLKDNVLIMIFAGHEYVMFLLWNVFVKRHPRVVANI